MTATPTPAPLFAGLASPVAVTVTWFAAEIPRSPVACTNAVPLTAESAVLSTVMAATAASFESAPDPPEPSDLPDEFGLLVASMLDVDPRVTPEPTPEVWIDADPSTTTVAVDH